MHKDLNQSLKFKGYVLIETILGVAILSMALVTVSIYLSELNASLHQLQGLSERLDEAENIFQSVYSGQVIPDSPQLTLTPINGLLRLRYTLPNQQYIDTYLKTQ